MSARAAALLLALGLLAAAGPGCAISHITVGSELPSTDGLLVGRTTKAEALALLGAPIEIRRQFDGEMLLWKRRVTHATRLRLVPFLPIYEEGEGRTDDDVLALLFGRDGVLAGFGEQRDIAPQP